MRTLRRGWPTTSGGTSGAETLAAPLVTLSREFTAPTMNVGLRQLLRTKATGDHAQTPSGAMEEATEPRGEGS